MAWESVVSHKRTFQRFLASMDFPRKKDPQEVWIDPAGGNQGPFFSAATIYAAGSSASARAQASARFLLKVSSLDILAQPAITMKDLRSRF